MHHSIFKVWIVSRRDLLGQFLSHFPGSLALEKQSFTECSALSRLVNRGPVDAVKREAACGSGAGNPNIEVLEAVASKAEVSPALFRKDG